MPLETDPSMPEVISVKPRRPTISASDTSATVDITFAHRDRSPTDLPDGLSPPQPSPPERSASPFLRQVWSKVMADTPLSPDAYDTALDNHGVDYVITFSFPSTAGSFCSGALLKDVETDVIAQTEPKLKLSSHA